LIPELVLIDGVRESKQDAIREITEALYLAGRTEDARLIEEALWDREACRAKDLRHQPSQRRVHTARVCCSALVPSFPGPQAQAFSRGHLMMVATIALKTPSPLPKDVFKQLHLQLTLLWSKLRVFLSAVPTFQGVVQRLGWPSLSWLVRDRSSQDANVGIVGERERLCASRNIHRVDEKIRITVCLVSGCRVVAVRGKPSDIGTLDEGRPKPDHFGVFVQANARRASGARSRWHLLFVCFPDTVVPLADESCPFLYSQVQILTLDFEGSVLVAVGCRG
jgi:hypothetical protein